MRSGELPAIKVGGRGQWRVEATELETYIQRMYSETKTFVGAHPFGQIRRVGLAGARHRAPADVRPSHRRDRENGTRRRGP